MYIELRKSRRITVIDKDIVFPSRKKKIFVVIDKNNGDVHIRTRFIVFLK